MEETNLRIVQVALSCRDNEATRSWYAECFGFRPSGTMDPDALPEPPDIAAVQGVPGASTHLRWAVDQQDFFQLELFQYRAPEPRPLPGDWQPCDIGYTTLGLHVADFDATLQRLADRGVEPLTPPIGPEGARRACVRDPDGVLLELMEDDPRVPGSGPRARPEIPVATRFLRASVPDLRRSLAYFADTLGMGRHEPVLHGPEHEGLWGLSGATRRVELLSSGDFWLELVQYDTPRPVPLRHDYRISDLGILNLAFGTRDPEAYAAARDAVRDAGYDLTTELEAPIGASVYAMDDHRFSIELMYLSEAGNEFAGFVPEQRQPA